MEFLKTTGVTDEDCYPYVSGDGNDYPCDGRCADWDQRLVKISGYTIISGGAVPPLDGLKSYIQSHPITCAMTVYDSFWSYVGGVYAHIDGEEERGGHGVIILGWDDTTSSPCWICKNSWGEGWGETGYFRIKRGDSSIGTHAVSIYYDAPPPPPPPPTGTHLFTPVGIAFLLFCLLAVPFSMRGRQTR